MSLDHAGSELAGHGIGLESLCLFKRLIAVSHPVSPVNFLCDKLDSLSQRRFEVVKELEIVLLLARLDDSLGKLDRPVATFEPVLRNSG